MKCESLEELIEGESIETYLIIKAIHAGIVTLDDIAYALHKLRGEVRSGKFEKTEFDASAWFKSLLKREPHLSKTAHRHSKASKLKVKKK